MDHHSGPSGLKNNDLNLCHAEERLGRRTHGKFRNYLCIIMGYIHKKKWGWCGLLYPQGV